MPAAPAAISSKPKAAEMIAIMKKGNGVQPHGISSE
jgi:hypothetical protein